MLYQIKTEDGTDLEDQGEEAEEKVYCAACRHLVTEGCWRIAVDGDHEHSRFNPAGLRYRILLFKEAPGLDPIGRPDPSFTWFPGYAWQVVLCGRCREHLGWMFSGAEPPRVFFGLIGEKLTTRLSDG